MKSKLYRYRYVLLLGGVIYLLALVLTLPAVRAYALVGKHLNPLVLYTLDGTVWSGHAAVATFGPRRLESLSWQLRPWMILAGRIEVAIAFTEDHRHTQAVIGRTLGGAYFATDVSTRLPPKVLERALNLPNTGLEGETLVNLDEIRLKDGRLQYVAGRLSWQRAGLIDPKTALGGYTLTLSTDTLTNKIDMRGVLKEQVNSPLRAEGVLHITPEGRYQFTGALSLRDPARTDLEQALRFFGSPGPGGKVPLTAAGNLPYVGEGK